MTKLGPHGGLLLAVNGRLAEIWWEEPREGEAVLVIRYLGNRGTERYVERDIELDGEITDDSWQLLIQPHRLAPPVDWTKRFRKVK